MKMSRSADERRMPQSRSRPARRREGGAWLGFAIALWAPKVGAAPPTAQALFASLTLCARAKSENRNADDV